MSDKVKAVTCFDAPCILLSSRRVECPLLGDHDEPLEAPTNQLETASRRRRGAALQLATTILLESTSAVTLIWGKGTASCSSSQPRA